MSEPIWQRNGIWYALFHYDDVNGKRKKFYKSTGIKVGSGEQKKKALRIAKGWQREAMSTGMVVGITTQVPKQPTQDSSLPRVSGFLRFWFNDHVQDDPTKPGGWKPSTQKGYESVIRLHIDPALGDLRLDEVTPRHIHLFTKQKEGDGYAGKTIANMLGVITSMYGYAQDIFPELRHPVRKKHWPSTKPVKKRLAYTEEQIQKFIATCQRIEPDAFVFFALLFTTGMRWGEITALRWGDFDFNLGVIHLTRAQYQGYESLPKNGEPRDVFLHKDILPLIHGYRSPKCRPNDVVFPSKRKMQRELKPGEGKFLRYYEMIGAYRRVQKAAGLPEINFHEARHSFNSWLLNKRKSPFMVMEALGHKTIGMTLKDYAHTEIEAVREDVSSLKTGLLTEDDFPEPIGEA